MLRSKVRLVWSLALVALCAPWNALPADDKEKDGGPFDDLKFRSIGPAIGGRVARVAGVAGQPLVYYAATAQSGVWKSEDGGIRWKPLFDDQPFLSTGAIAVAPSDPNVIYVGSGEANIRGNVQPGVGIFRSNDAGKSWKHVWKQEGQIGTIVVHPTNSDVAWAAVLGHAFGPNAERGVYRTRDGGATWQQVLFKDADTGASDVAIDPTNPRNVFAGLWPARRHPWGMTSGGPGGGLYRSTDGGDHWDQVTEHGLPEGIVGKVGIAVAPSEPSRVYALIESEKGGLSASTVRTTPARAGGWSTATTPCASAPGTTRRSPSIRRIPTRSGSRRCRSCSRSTAAGRSARSTAIRTATSTTPGSTPPTATG
jgi:hypothetical protein